jgi:hypothetical protein
MVCLLLEFCSIHLKEFHSHLSSNRKTGSAVEFAANYYYYYYLQNRSKAFKQRKTFSSDGLPCRNCKIAIVNSVYTSSKTCNGNNKVIIHKLRVVSNFFDRDARRSGPTIHFHGFVTLVQNLL